MISKSGGINNRAYINNDFDTKEYLQVNSCGIYNKISEKTSVTRADGRKDYQIIIVIKGKVVINNYALELKKNEFIIIPPKVPNDYSYFPDTDALWIHFAGSNVCNILNEYSITTNQKYRLNNANECIWSVEKMIDEFNQKNIGYMNNCNGLLLNFLTNVARNIDPDEKSSQINGVALYMKNHFSENIGIIEYAKMSNFSISRFSHLFKESFGISARSYITELRISHAKELLLTTDINITHISEMLGYSNSLYFSKIFKKYTGCSPLNYRKINKGKTS